MVVFKPYNKNKYCDEVDLDEDHQSVIDYVNEKFPINTKHFEKNIDIITEKYPYVSRLEVVEIIKAFWESTREILITGKIIKIRRIITDFKFNIRFLSNSKEPYPFLEIRYKVPKRKKK